MKLEDLEAQNVGGDQQGITTIVVVGDMLEVEGWYDAVAIWFARVRLTPEQRAALREALADAPSTTDLWGDGERDAGGWPYT